MENQNQTNAGTAPEQQQAEGTGKTFTQEEVNNIISDRLKREREKFSKEQEEKLNEREKAIEARELRLTATEKLTAAGLPKTLVDAINCSDEETMNKSIEIISKAFQGKEDTASEKPQGKVYYTPRGLGSIPGPDFRNAMGIK